MTKRKKKKKTKTKNSETRTVLKRAYKYGGYQTGISFYTVLPRRVEKKKMSEKKKPSRAQTYSVLNL